MGMFDELRCKYPLPLEGANALLYQTKDTDAQYLDTYEIREDGTLWHEVYDTEDHSKLTLWEKEHPGEKPPEELTADPMASFIGCATRVNQRWEQDYMTGEVRFYTNTGEDGWVEWLAYFEKGNLIRLNLITNRKGT